MVAAVNLIRDARVFFTTNVDGDGKIRTTGTAHSATTTFEIQVLDGLSFSQSSGSETVSINEAGTAPVRGQRSYNTTVEAGDWSFSTYLRPHLDAAVVSAEEKYLWNALTAVDPIGGTNPGWTDGDMSVPTLAQTVFTHSNKLQLQKFGVIIAMKGNTYLLHNCAIESVSVDFGIDQIATAAWSGKCTEIEQVSAITFGTITGSDPDKTQAITGGLGAGAVAYKVIDCSYLANKLSVATVDFGGTIYTLPITGGNITVNNNLTYLIPSVVGAVNKPITYFTGTRTFSGSLTAYLRFSADTGETGDLFSAISTAAATNDRPTGSVSVKLGGSTGTYVELLSAYAKLQVPNVTTDQVVGASFDFMPEGQTGLDSTNELVVKYSHAYTP
jgi:hypothetical protein